MATRRRAAQEPAVEPAPIADETEPEVNELDAIEVSDEDVAEYEASAVEAIVEPVEDVEPEKAPVEAESDKSVVEETDEVNVTFVGMRDQFARVPSKIQVIIPEDGTEADDADAYIEHGMQFDFVPGQTHRVDQEQKRWLLKHPVYNFR